MLENKIRTPEELKKYMLDLKKCYVPADVSANRSRFDCG